MPRVTLCSVCNGHAAINYQLKRSQHISEIKHTFTVNAASIDLCNGCWNRLTNRRSLTLEGIEQRLIERRERILDKYRENMEGAGQ